MRCYDINLNILYKDISRNQQAVSAVAQAPFCAVLCSPPSLCDLDEVTYDLFLLFITHIPKSHVGDQVEAKCALLLSGSSLK